MVRRRCGREDGGARRVVAPVEPIESVFKESEAGRTLPFTSTRSNVLHRDMVKPFPMYEI